MTNFQKRLPLKTIPFLLSFLKKSYQHYIKKNVIIDFFKHLYII